MLINDKNTSKRSDELEKKDKNTSKNIEQKQPKNYIHPKYPDSMTELSEQ